MQQILGLNARNRLYLAYNRPDGRKIADSKLLTKKILSAAGLPTPKVLVVFKSSKKVFNFPWETLPENFVLKPSAGYGGGGIVIIKRKAKWAGEWRLMNDAIIRTSDLRLHTLDILAGQYSLHNLPDVALVEERIKIAKIFREYAFHGTPDIRVIVFNKVPVAAMLRLPSPESEGRANLHQGAIGVGVDLATGITTYGVHRGRLIRSIPWTKRKVNGLKIPNWTYILTLAVRCQEVIPSLGFLGVDLVFDKEHGPMVLEINARPGLEIQNANHLPLRRRLQRVEGLEVCSNEHGVRIAQSLFADRLAEQVKTEEQTRTIGTLETIKIRAGGKSKVEIKAKIDTGSWRTSIDRQTAQDLGLLNPDNILWKKVFKSSLGKEERPIIGLTYYLMGKKINTIAGVANRENLRRKVIIGRRDLRGFTIKTES